MILINSDILFREEGSSNDEAWMIHDIYKVVARTCPPRPQMLRQTGYEKTS